MSAVVGIDHVQLAMPAGAAAEAAGDAFYEDVLGLAAVPKPPALARRGGRWYRSGRTQLHLGVETAFRPARKAHPALLVTELDRLVERLGAGGHPWRWDEELPGVRRGFTEDPFGNRIELIEVSPDPGA